MEASQTNKRTNVSYHHTYRKSIRIPSQWIRMKKKKPSRNQVSGSDVIHNIQPPNVPSAMSF